MFTVWKLIPTVFLAGTIVTSFTAHPPREPVPRAELRRIVLAIALLYGVGALTLAVHRMALADVVFGAGLLLCSLALWLSRGPAGPPRDDEGEGGGGSPPPLAPPPVPPEFDWSFYEDQFREGVRGPT